MQASVTAVCTSATPSSSIPIACASPVSAWRTTATFDASAGISSVMPELGCSMVSPACVSRMLATPSMYRQTSDDGDERGVVLVLLAGELKHRRIEPVDGD